MKYDILNFKTDVTELKINGNKLDGLQTQRIQKSAARVFKQGQIFSAAVVGEFSEAQLLEKAERPGNVGLAYDYDLPETASLQSYHPPTTESRDKGLLLFKDFFLELQKEYPHLNWSGAAKFRHTLKRFTGNYGGTLESGGADIQWFLLYKRFGSADFAEGFVSFQGTHFNFHKTFRSCEPLLKAVNSSASISAKKMPVLLLEPWTITERLAKDLRPEKYHAGSSFLSGKLDTAIFSPQVTLKDISYSPQHGKFDRFDGEGVLHQNPVIFENGRFTNLLYDLRQAKKAQTQSTGNGLRNFNSGASFGLHDLALSPGQDDIWDMLKSVPECLVVVMGYGGNTSDQWEYSSPVQVGYLFRHGQAVGRVPPLSIKTSFKDLLGKDLIGLSREGFGGSLNPAILTQMEVITH